MKKFINLLLVAAAILLVWLCYDSVMQPIRFDRQKKTRDKAVIQRLIDIRTAQVEFKTKHGAYAPTFDTLISFVKNGKIPFVKKEGVLTDDQLDKGLTEQEAADIVRKGNKRLIKKWGLEGFKRDTIYANVRDTLFGKKFDAGQLRYVPFADTMQFKLQAGDLQTQSGIIVQVFEASVPYSVYLNGLDKQEIKNLEVSAKSLDKFPGLRVGNIYEANNNAGNWE